MYSDIFNVSFTNLSFDYTIIENFDKFLKHYKPDTKTLKNTAEEYYQNLIFKDFSVYHRFLFTDYFSRYYIELSKIDRNKVEEKLFVEFDKAFKNSNWNLENYITDIIKPIWKNIDNKEDFKNLYLSIYLRDTLDKFSQKKFANELVYGKDFSFKFTENWLLEKITSIYMDYNKNVEESDIKFVARTYSPLNKILNKENWLEYINFLFERVIGENA